MSGNERRSRGRRYTRDTSWDRVAGWYDGWVGRRGSTYHREIAIPAVIELLQARPGERILDLGAGQGVLAPAIAGCGARYTGVDASPRLIAAARRRHGDVGRFLAGDARDLPSVRGLGRGAFDAAVFLLSVQDMDPLERVVRSLGWALGPRGRVVMLMTHPAFRVPRHSGWAADPGGGLPLRRVDRYLGEMDVPMKALVDEPPTRSFHRPVSAYINTLASVGLLVDAMLELPDLPPRARPRGRRDASENPEIPLFLGLRAIRR